MSKENKKGSYTAAESLPVKLIKLKEKCVTSSNDIKPIHIQVSPTNKCNLNCSFCSCSNVERGQELEINKLIDTMRQFKKLGARAITITGGGEPCCYPDLPVLLKMLDCLGIKIGLVSNGLLLNKIIDQLKYLTWCRVSASDFRDIDQLISVLTPLVSTVQIDWAISYVVTKEFDIDKFVKVVEFANKFRLTHVRAVRDLLDLDSPPMTVNIQNELKKRDIDDSLVVYQDRTASTRGTKSCLVSLLKPFLATDGYFYPCCGVQYAIDGTVGFFPKQMRLCKQADLLNYFNKQNPFDGRVCDVCYYDGYNNLLETMINNYDHEDFV